ncbi:MAG TPA: pilus assembly protein PilZ, partial [Moraxellaceae bacterium]|nr:pilus assembly protein PilZ [Moraxellaceae bacterium]
RQQGLRAQGIGIQLTGEEGDKARRKIETILAGALKADRPTHTM